ncbi:MAG: cyclophilin-like fold protein [Candidatus Thorarchaeota archaeon]|nr:cyclophilin-like fold protein [Candidatus Thorarchaeota archaeon]
MPDLSDTDIRLEFIFEDDIIVKGTINRIFAPLVVEEIKSRLPIEGRAAVVRNEMQITLGISKGNAKPTNDVKKGDIAYVPLGDSLCIYLDNMHTYSQVNILGKITTDDDEISQLRKVRRGSLVEIKTI